MPVGSRNHFRRVAPGKIRHRSPTSAQGRHGPPRLRASPLGARSAAVLTDTVRYFPRAPCSPHGASCWPPPRGGRGGSGRVHRRARRPRVGQGAGGVSRCGLTDEDDGGSIRRPLAELAVKASRRARRPRRRSACRRRRRAAPAAGHASDGAPRRRQAAPRRGLRQVPTTRGGLSCDPPKPPAVPEVRSSSGQGAEAT